MGSPKLKILSLIVLIFSVAGVVTPSQDASLEKIVVSYGSLEGSLGPLWVANDAHLFIRQGLDVNLVYIPSSSQPVMSLLSGSTKFMNYGALPSLEAYLRGGDTVLLASPADRVEHHLVVQPSITKITELRGKVIGVGSLGSSLDTVVRQGLRLSGVSDSDVTILPVGDNRSRLAALQNNRVQAVNLSGVTLATALKSGFKTLIDFSKLPIRIYISSIISTRSYISRNHETTLKFLKGWLEGVYMFRADREVAINIMRKHTRVQDGELIDKVYNHYRELNNPTAKPSISVIQSMLQILSEMGRKTTGRPAEGFIDTTFFQTLETTGFLDQMESRYPKVRD